jgi:eukaryotic-like serine/threonine-protein kinase
VVRSIGVVLEPLHLTDFELGGPLGSGATSHVFAATHRQTGQGVAVKMLEPSHRDSAEMRTRLHREAIMLAGVESPHVGKVLGFGYEDEQPFLVLERLRGETLADLLKREGRVPIDRLSNWIEQLLVGVRDCHQAGVIHRDIKPANIFLEEPGSLGIPTVRLIDFGVARLKEIAQHGRSLTSTHHLLGSMGYMAPEQFQNAKRVGPQADVYAIGVVIFRSIAGRLPFVSRSFEALIKMKVEKPPPVLSSIPGVGRNERLDAFVQTALAPHPSSRFDSGHQMLEAWWRVAANLDRDGLFVDGVEVVFEFEDDIEVSTDVGGIKGTIGQTMADIESTTINHRGSGPVSDAEDDDTGTSGA